MRMKRRLFLLVVTIAFLAGFGALLHSPPSLVDAITGATPKARRNTMKKTQLEGSYVFCVNTQSESLADDSIREVIMEQIQGKEEIALTEEKIKFRLYVSETDSALARYARGLCEQLEQSGVEVSMAEYSDIMLRSRVVSGQYDAFLAAWDIVDVTVLQQADYIVIESEEMR